MTRGVKTKLTDEQWNKMGEYALLGCQCRTIAELMGINEDTLQSSKEIQAFLKQKRAIRKSNLRKQLDDHSVKNPVAAIFVSKQSEMMGGLGFSDTPSQANSLTDNALSELFKQIKPSKGVLPKDE
jgi:hypothetical protein